MKMTAKQEKPFFNTDAKLILRDWDTLANLLLKHTRLVKEIAHGEETVSDSKPKTLTQKQIDDAINGPYSHFFKQKITAYGSIMRIRTELTIKDDDIFKNARESIADIKPIPEKQLEKFSVADLDKMQDELDELIKMHNEQWEQHLDKWNDELIEALKQASLTLAELEINEFKGTEPLSELLDRFTELKVDLPKPSKTDLTFDKYLTMKAHIAIRSALSCQHQSHETADIKRVLKSINTTFNNIRKEEQALIKQQQSETYSIIENINI